MTAGIPALPWPALNDIGAAARLPNFPGVNFLATDPWHGAKGDNSADNTEAFRKAIDSASAAGGGPVIVPKGDYVTGRFISRATSTSPWNPGLPRSSGRDASEFACRPREPLADGRCARPAELRGDQKWHPGRERHFVVGQVGPTAPGWNPGS
ncbi:hypothetical protein ALI144C_21675 [Actinosynnema sp. ALI-1.44]|nr:hypothetical protein ALI144C_21675 [Actinosynnema sp. ALI-1.44]